MDSKTRAEILIWTGWAIMLGPIAIFLFMATFPKWFDANTILAWNYISSFWFIFYFPVGLVAKLWGQNMRKKAILQDSDINPT